MTRSLITPVLLGGAIVLLVANGIRSSFGLFQIPIAAEFGWARIEYSTALALQALFWGIGQPLFGALAEKIGDRIAIVIGIVLYAIGLVLSAYAISPLAHQSINMLLGLGIAGTGFGVILAMVGRAASDENRSMALAIAAASGSGGQLVGPPLTEMFLSLYPWQTVMFILAGVVLLCFIVLPLLRAPAMAPKAELEEKLSQILGKAFRDPSYTLIFIGFFSCGYHLAFILSHFPAYITEFCGPIASGSLLHNVGVTTTSALGAAAIAVIGFANIGGTLIAGWLGQRYTKKYLLAAIYAGRTLAFIAFILVPITPATVIVFSIVMGSLWLATVPLTSGLVAYIYGLRYMGTLYGIVFFSHQLGGFLGVWLGGWMFDLYGNYTAVWWVGIGVGALSAIVHLPIREVPLGQRPQPT